VRFRLVEFREMKFVAPLLMTVLIGGCSSATQTTQTALTTVAPSSSMSATSSVGSTSADSSVDSTSPTESLPVVAPTGTTLVLPSVPQKQVSTSVLNQITIGRPKLSVSQTTNLNPNGTSVTVRGSGYDISKGVYVIVCTQAAPGTQSTCVGGVNIDGSSSSSVWVSSNPPSYAIGLTTEFQPDGSFNITLLVVAKSGDLDCTLVRCGVVTRSDHLRYTDRTQDVFVPITFNTNP